MLKIRLKRVGKKGDSAFRIIVTEAGRGINSGKYIDQIGFYDPRIDKKEIDTEKAAKWLANGVQPTDTVYNLLVDAGVIEGRKKNVLPQKSAPVVETSEEESNEAPAADEPAVEAPAEEALAEETAAEETKEETPAEDTKEEAPAEETPAEVDTKDESEDENSSE